MRERVVKNMDKKELQDAYKQRKVIGGLCAIQNTANGKMLLAAVTNLQGYKNRFEFAKGSSGCIDLKLKADWEKFGKDVFEFVILEELVKNDLQTDKEFSEDVKTLKEMWLEKIDLAVLY